MTAIQICDRLGEALFGRGSPDLNLNPAVLIPAGSRGDTTRASCGGNHSRVVTRTVSLMEGSPIAPAATQLASFMEGSSVPRDKVHP